ncbi:hypothetical protein B0H39_002806 [Clostridium beijerinckii]|uniref:hypothetical protein n=1 Tax=Clostridium beijerinckii TaxID=1520 RepID=UPI0014949A44|nr:hypothetical protein [Clostridium beijerinckii]NOW84925.1 hypothetical protein [Clostridium beijerinckii]
MENTDILNEIMLNARQIPLYYQERTLDILKGMHLQKKFYLILPLKLRNKKIIKQQINFSGQVK